jgi:hypothetical protein
MCSLVQDAIIEDLDDALLFRYAADHPLAVEFDERFSGLVREFKGDGGVSIFPQLGGRSPGTRRCPRRDGADDAEGERGGD